MKVRCFVLSLMILVPSTRAYDPIGNPVPLACVLTTAISGMALVIAGALGVALSLGIGDKMHPCFGKPNQCCELVHIYPFTPTNCTERARGESCNDKTLFCVEKSGLVTAPKSAPYSSSTVTVMSLSAATIGAGVLLTAMSMLMSKVCILDIIRS